MGQEIKREGFTGSEDLSEHDPEFDEIEEVDDPGKPELDWSWWDNARWETRQWAKRNITKKTLWRAGYAIAGMISARLIGVNVAPILDFLNVNSYSDIKAMEQFLSNFDFSTTEMAVWSVTVIVFGAASWALRYFQKTKYLAAVKELGEVFSKVKEVRGVGSEGGKTVTKDEMKELLDEVLDAGEEVLLLFGVDFDLNQDGE